MSDLRFAALQTDPRYRLPKRKESRTAVDPRFKGLLTDQDFRKKASVDRYGRNIQPDGGKSELQKAYHVERADGSKKVTRKVVGGESEDEGDLEVEDDEVVQKRDPARGGGFSDASSSEEDGSEEEGSEDEANLAEGTAGQEAEEVPMGEVTYRIAAVNLDWDNIRATDIMAVASSFVPAHGKIESVTVYPSEFGRERMEREELEGPPREIFGSSKRRHDQKRVSEEDGDGDDDDDDDEEEQDEKIKRQLQQSQVDEGEEFDTAKLRQYQLERLRYYYAVISCDSKGTAKMLYDNMDGREYLATANFFDLRFIPDDTDFSSDKSRDECYALSKDYKPNDFKTGALTHSKVKLTWDDDDVGRKEAQKRAFSTGLSRKDVEENDLQAYIGSGSSDDGSVASRKSVTTPDERKKAKEAARKAKMRAALGLASEHQKSTGRTANGGREREEVIGDMQITFTSGLGGKANGENGDVFENEPQDEESTRQRYIRKERDRKQKRKERAKGSASQPDPATHPDEAETEAIDQGFEEPFFTDPSASKVAEKKAKKAEKAKKFADQIAQDEDAAGKRKELELLLVEDKEADQVDHFDMREIEKAAKRARRKGKKTNQSADADAAPDNFQVEAEDPRFNALFSSHEFAIDPTNPRYKGTGGMKALLEEGRKKRKVGDGEEGGGGGGGKTGAKKAKKGAALGKEAGDGELKGLVARLQAGKTKAKSGR